jgi:hypothetical protein
MLKMPPRRQLVARERWERGGRSSRVSGDRSSLALLMSCVGHGKYGLLGVGRSRDVLTKLGI